MAQMKRRIFAGATLDQEVVTISDQAAKNVKKAKPRLRFKDATERAEHRRKMALRRFIRWFNENFHPGDWYITPTLDDAHEVHTMAEAKRIRSNYRRRIKRAYPNAVLAIPIGRGKSTARIHFHVVAHGVPLEALVEAWTWGKVQAPRQLRVHNYYEIEGVGKVDCGANYRGLATYLFNHWTEEVGGHYVMTTRQGRQPEAEKPTVAKRRYSDKHPPDAPPGSVYIGRDTTAFGYSCYHYIWDPESAAVPWRPKR